MNSSTLMFDFLAKEKLTPDKMQQTISSWSDSKFHSFVETLDEYLPYDEAASGQGIFDFTASAELGGSSFPCSHTDCRLRRAAELARFAALYAQKVVLPSPVRRRPPVTVRGDDRIDLLGDLAVLYYFRPLLESGILVFSPNSLNLCHDCAKEFNRMKETLTRSTRAMINDYIADVRIEVKQVHGRTVISFKGPDILFEGDEPVEVFDQAKPELARKRKSTLTMEYLRPVIHDLLVQNATSLTYGSNYLTTRELQHRLAQAINIGPVEQHSTALFKAFAHGLPVLRDQVDIRKLLKLRQEEGEAFVLYRSALTKALQDAESTDETHLRQLFEGEVQDELAKIDLTLKNARRFLTGSIAGDLTVATGFVGIGLFFGILEQNAAKILPIIGGLKFFGDMKNKYDQIVRERLTARQNRYYFLWKLGKSLKRL